MKQEENFGKKLNKNEILKESIIEEMVYYLYSKGMVLKNKENTGVINVPVCIFPSPIPRALFNKIEFYQIAFNKMIDKMSRDVEFLKNTLNPYNIIISHFILLNIKE